MADEQLDDTGAGSKLKEKPTAVLIILGTVFLLFLVGMIVWLSSLFIGGGDGRYKGYSEFEKEFRRKSQDEIAYLLEPEYVRPQTFTINLKGGKKYLKIDLAYALQDQEAITYLQKKLPILDDLVIAYIQSRTIEDLSSGHGIEMLKLHLLQLANSIFDNEGYHLLAKSNDRFPVKQVLITRFFLN